MIIKYFSCKLLSDVVVNASLATEGNMKSLDYIPGSNFLGVAAKNYAEFNNNAYEIFHSGKVSFGDAFIAKGNIISYSIPFSLFTDKLKKDILKDNVWVHHAIYNKEITDENGNKIQLKQMRGGYFNRNNDFFKTVKKEFYLKSAYDAQERRSKESAMFGFEAIKKGQEFVFSVLFEDETYVNDVINALKGIQHVGKSKTAEYGLVDITEILETVETFENKPVQNNELVIYAQSNLCFVNKYGQFTLQPKAEDFGVTGEILWEKSQVRTYSYSPWNSTRNATSTQRDVILKGSVIVVRLNGDVDVNSLPFQVGEFNAEGLGRVIYNPEFLEFTDDDRWILTGKLNEVEVNENKGTVKINSGNKSAKTKIGKLLLEKERNDENDKKIANAVLNNLNNKILLSRDITKTQWGAIRTYATQAKTVDELLEKLFKEKIGYLVHGVAAERIWDYKNGKRRKELEKLIKANRNLGTKFVVKFASEIAKKNNNG